MGTAGQRHSRLDVLQEMGRVVFKKGIYQDSREGMTPIRQDAPSLLPFAVVFIGLLLNPRSEQQLTLNTIANYSLGTAIPRLLTMEPGSFLGDRLTPQ